MYISKVLLYNGFIDSYLSTNAVSVRYVCMVIGEKFKAYHMMEYRFYSFTAALYISPLQCGLQTAHAVSDMYSSLFEFGDESTLIKIYAYSEWARRCKTIIICNALNSQGVRDAYREAKYFGDMFNLPSVMFCEDDMSLNEAPTATGMVVSQAFYDARPTLDGGYDVTVDGRYYKYEAESNEAKFVKFLKGYRLA